MLGFVILWKQSVNLSTGRVADRYPEKASSNLARVNIFQLTPAKSDYQENISIHVFLRMILKYSLNISKRKRKGSS